MRRFVIALAISASACSSHVAPTGQVRLKPHTRMHELATRRNIPTTLNFDGYNIHVDGMERSLQTLTPAEFELMVSGAASVTQRDWYLAAADQVLTYTWYLSFGPRNEEYESRTRSSDR